MAGKAKARFVSTHNSVSIFYLTLALRTMIVRMISTAQTGFFYTTQRLRQGPSLSAVKYDPRGAYVSGPPWQILTRFLVKSRVLFVESKKTAKK